jgi:hypothetical protein
VGTPAAIESDSGSAGRAGEVFHGPAWLCGSTREVACSITLRGYELSVAGVGEFFVALRGQQISRTSGDLDPSDPAVAETVLGPALILALALHGTFCLHASAVLSPAGALLFLGPSGTGKSTLGSYLGGASGGFTPLTDDITPVVMSSAGPEVWPHFPQFKLPADRQPAHVAPERIGRIPVGLPRDGRDGRVNRWAGPCPRPCGDGSAHRGGPALRTQSDGDLSLADRRRMVRAGPAPELSPAIRGASRRGRSDYRRS